MYPVSDLANIIGVIVAVGLGLLEVRRLVRKDPALTLETVHRRAPYMFVLVFVAVVLVGFYFAMAWKQSLVWSLPMWFQLRGTGVIWVTILALMAFLATVSVVVAYRSAHPRRRTVFFASPFLLAAIYFIQWSFNAPIAHRLESAVTPDGVVLQTSGVSCGVATVVNIAGRFGIERTEKEMAHFLGATRMGTSTAQMIYGLERLGFTCRRVAAPDGAPVELRAPAILLVDHPDVGREKHAVAYMGTDGETFEVWDPLVGRTFLTQEEMNEIWHGHAVECWMEGKAEEE